METSPTKLVTIVAPESSQDELLTALGALGAIGCSIVRAHGRGIHGVRPGGWSGAGLEWHGPNVLFEIVVEPSAVDRVLEMLETRNDVYGPFVAWIADVSAWPVARFSH